MKSRLDTFAPWVNRDCDLCRGTGIGRHGPPDVSRCGACNGRGYHVVEATECEACEGVGSVRGQWWCEDCDGEGLVPLE